MHVLLFVHVYLGVLLNVVDYTFRKVGVLSCLPKNKAINVADCQQYVCMISYLLSSGVFFTLLLLRLVKIKRGKILLDVHHPITRQLATKTDVCATALTTEIAVLLSLL